MNQDATSTPSCDANSMELQWSSYLFVLLGRLRLFFSLVEQSLRSEYKYEDATVEDWLKTLEWLEDSFFSIYQLLHRPLPSPELTAITSRRLMAFKGILEQSRQLLVKHDHSAVVKLFALLSNISRSRRLLLGWQCELRNRYGDRVTASTSMVAPDRVEPSLGLSAIRDMTLHLADATVQLELRNEDATCMALRRAYFLLYFVAVSYPDQWTIDLHGQVHELHTKALDVFPGGGLAYERIRDRQKKLETFDARQLQRLVLMPAA